MAGAGRAWIAAGISTGDPALRPALVLPAFGITPITALEGGGSLLGASFLGSASGTASFIFGHCYSLVGLVNLMEEKGC